VLQYCALEKRDPRRDLVPSWQNGWQGVTWRKAAGDLILDREAKREAPSRRGSIYTLYQNRDGKGETDGIQLVGKEEAYFGPLPLLYKTMAICIDQGNALAACGKSRKTSPKHVTYEMFWAS
jgi:hypothetical protein